MKYTMYVVALWLGLFLGQSAAYGQTAPEWIQYAFTDDNSSIRAHALAANEDGVYVTGDVFRIPHFNDVTLLTGSQARTSMFLAHYDASGGLQWARRGSLINPIGPVGFSLALDAQNNLYTSEGYEFISDAGMFTVGGVAVYKYTPEGESLFGMPVGSFEDERIEDQPSFIKGLGADDQGNTYIAGVFQDTLALGTDTLIADLQDLFVASFDPTGAVRWVEPIQGPGALFISGLDLSPYGNFTVDKTGTVTVGGIFGPDTVFGEGQPNETRMTRSVAAVARYDAEGVLQWVRTDQEGGLAVFGDASLQRLATDEAGNLLALWGIVDTGGQISVTVGDTVLTDPGFGGAFLTKYAPGGTLAWVRQLRSNGNEFLSDLITDAEGNVYVAGSFDALELHLEDTVLRKDDLQADRTDGFVAAYSPSGRLLGTLHAAGRETQRINALAIGPGGKLYVTGEFEDTMQLGSVTATSHGGFDMFVAQYETSVVLPTEPPSEIPTRVVLEQNYPNPFNPETTIRYQLAQPGSVRLVVFDVLGREVATLVETIQTAGTHEATFDAANLPSGLYLYRLETGERTLSRTMLLAK